MSRRHAQKHLGQVIHLRPTPVLYHSRPPEGGAEEPFPPTETSNTRLTRPEETVSKETFFPPEPTKKRPPRHPRFPWTKSKSKSRSKSADNPFLSVVGVSASEISDSIESPIKGDPKSFPGETVYLVPLGYAKVQLPIPTFVKRFDLVRGVTPAQSPKLGISHPSRLLTMMNHVQIASTPTADTGGSLLLHFDHRRYLFGRLSEGTQRALSQRKYTVGKLERMFVSGQINWETTGGMLGLMLTVADVVEGSRRELENQNHMRRLKGKVELSSKAPDRIEIHGGPNLAYSIAAARSFIFRKGLPIKPIEVNEDPRLTNPDGSKPDWEDDAIQVWKVPIFSSGPSSNLSTSRKRSHEAMTAEDESMLTPVLGSDQTSAENQKMDRESIQGIVEVMFNSDWRMDALYETKLYDVRLPATIFVRKDGQVQKYKGPLPGDEGEVPNIDVLVRYPWPATKVGKLPSPSPVTNSSICYIVKNRGRRGKFNPKVAIEHGVQPREFKFLAEGKTVKGKDGVEVTPDMVLDDPIKPVGFAVIDIEDKSFIESFLSRQEWKTPAFTDGVPIFYWLLGPSVVDDPRIQGFMRDRPEVRHIIMAPDACPNMLAMESYATMMAKLRRIDPDRFPIPHFDNTCRDLSFIGPNVEVARVGMKAQLVPGFQLKDDEIVPFTSFPGLNAMSSSILNLADKAKARIQDPGFLAEVEEAEKDIPDKDTEIISLGTGSALPSKYRNVSSTLIRVPQYGSYILDAGENTIGQLRRTFPAEEVTQILQDLRCIVISHMHADHHLGTISIIRAWRDATAQLDPQPKLSIFSPPAMRHFITEYSKIDPIPMERLCFSHVVWPKCGRGVLPADDPSRLASAIMVPVRHCADARAAVLTWPSGLKVAYSGDCRPSDEFVAIGEGATLLIHESTFDDDKRDDAMVKRHCTMSEALDVAYRMGARRVLLTHFSQRYSRLPITDTRTSATGKDQAVLLAFDHMRVKLGQFRHAQAFLPAIKRFFDLDLEIE